ncbi:hypothetical protein QRD43_07370 [Pelomonas sp. APW6]|uniref:Transcriptional regulator n=1 Tax=Roseateles subflavus TaxID=3053353 RepID=A0ABT7LFU8_9BURK|nr:hypothetical protein [Pelomonas sp. APW6]MDL5031724.1 hypothetical protein [Pelomonas sp. APW6]
MNTPEVLSRQPPRFRDSIATPVGRDRWLYLALALLVGGAWATVRHWQLTAASTLGYWLGVSGGVAMLLLFAYPLRKRWRRLQRWGAARDWFAVHMVLGIAGPVLILLHCAFTIGSLNAGVALYSMLIVAGSGVVGRFLYLRTHRGLSGGLQGLQSVRDELGLNRDEAHRALAFAPVAEAMISRFEARVSPAALERAGWLQAFVVLPWVRWRTETQCLHALHTALRLRSRERDWGPGRRHQEWLTLRGTVQALFRTGLRVAQYERAVRLFALWHVLHVPFVYVMVLCAIVHIVAVHVY